jgi:hypothetical protein
VNEKLPWKVVPAWKREDLEFVVRLAARVREDVVKDLNKPGDDSWSIGCVFLNRWRAAIWSASGDRPDIEVIDESRHFVFGIRGVPVRTFRAKSEDAPPPSRACVQKELERHAKGQLALPYPDLQWAWRLRMVTNRKELPVAFVYEQINEFGATRYPWLVPEFLEKEDRTTVWNVASMARPGVELAPFEVLGPAELAEVKSGDSNAE